MSPPPSSPSPYRRPHLTLSPLDPTTLPEAIDVSDNTAALAAVDTVIAAGPFTDTWESLSGYETPLWFRDAKFGIFVHWGAFSVPAFHNEWYPRNLYKPGSTAFEHHVATYGPQSQFGYKDFLPYFTMEKFEPTDWVGLFRRAGAQYVVPVAEHHDGYAMYPTERSRWSTVQIGPKRDLLGDLLGAVDDAWLVRGVSSHRAEHWFYMNGGLNYDSDVRDPAYLDLYGPALRKEMNPTERFLEDWLLRTVEVIDAQKPQVIYFDAGIEEPSFEPYLRRLAAYYYNRAAEWGREVVINYKWDAFRTGSAVVEVERGTMNAIMPFAWQADTAMSRTSWSWIPNHDYKSSKDLIAELADVVSKNGNLLLNVGPRSDGLIPSEEVRLLEDIGAWLAVNGEAIYGTRPWTVCGEGPTRAAAGHFADQGSHIEYGVEDFRFTTMEEVGHEYVYAIALAPAEDGHVRVRNFGADNGLFDRDIVDVRVLGHVGDLEWTRTGTVLDVVLPEDLPTTAGGPVVRVEIAPEVVEQRVDFFHGIWL